MKAFLYPYYFMNNCNESGTWNAICICKPIYRYVHIHLHIHMKYNKEISFKLSWSLVLFVHLTEYPDDLCVIRISPVLNKEGHYLFSRATNTESKGNIGLFKIIVLTNENKLDGLLKYMSYIWCIYNISYSLYVNTPPPSLICWRLRPQCSAESWSIWEVIGSRGLWSRSRDHK